MQKKIVKSSISVLLLIIFGKGLSFIRDIVISYQFGSSYKTDAYFGANVIPSILFTAILSSYLVLLIPRYKNIQTQESFEAADVFVSKLVNLFGVLSIILSISGYFLIEYLIEIVSPGFDFKTKELAISLGKILVLSFPFSSITLILSTISNANHKYYAPHIIPIFSASFIIVGVLLFSQDYGIYSLAISGVLAFIFQLIIQIVISKKHFNYTFSIQLLDENIKKMSWLVLPVFLGFSVDQINLLVNSILASNLVEGSLSSLNYAQRLQATINGTFSTAIITVIYPLLSSLHAEGKRIEFSNIVKNSLKTITILLLPIVVFLAINAKSFVAIIYYRGKFNDTALLQTSDVFFFYAFNVFFMSIREVVLRLYYINNNTKIPLYASFISLLFNIILSLMLVHKLKVVGLSLANLVATFISTLLLLILIRKKAGIKFRLKGLIGFIKKLVLPLFVFIIIQVLCRQTIVESENRTLFFMLNFIISITIYFIGLLLVKQHEMVEVYSKIKNKFRK